MQKKKNRRENPKERKNTPSSKISRNNFITWQDTVLLFSILALWLLQYKFTQASTSQIRYEELAESVRNPWWVQNGYITDGISSNVGWYGTLALIYNVFGFSIFTAKYFRLALHLGFLVSLAVTFRNRLGPLKSIIPLVVIGLSPVLLYYNTFQTSFGTDIQYAGICLGILFLLKFNNTVKDLLLHFLVWLLAMVASMSYPAFLLYLPVLFLVYLWRWKILRGISNIKTLAPGIAVSAVGLTAPLLLVFSYIKNNELLVHDPVSGAGLFRGGGKLEMDFGVLAASLRQTLSDFFKTGSSYYFDLAKPDFEGGLGIISVGVILAASVYTIVKDKSIRIPLLLAFLLLGLNLIIPNLTSHFPGLRRCTGALAAFYSIVIILYASAANADKINQSYRWIVFITVLLIPLHSLFSIPANLKSLREPGPFRESWFTIEKSPDKSMQKLMLAVESGQSLSCNDSNAQPGPCRYFEVYAALAGYRYWNQLPEIKIMGYDWYKKENVPLSVQGWVEKKFPL